MGWLIVGATTAIRKKLFGHLNKVHELGVKNIRRHKLSKNKACALERNVQNKDVQNHVDIWATHMAIVGWMVYFRECMRHGA